MALLIIWEFHILYFDHILPLSFSQILIVVWISYPSKIHHVTICPWEEESSTNEDDISGDVAKKQQWLIVIVDLMEPRDAQEMSSTSF